ncbi:MAG: MarR family winged helix-turn-helix transcriptional regulator [Candidatus Ornithomonoglobus sp.]
MTHQDIGYFIKNIDEKLKTKADSDLKSHNLTLSQSLVLTYLCSKGGLATQKEIEEHLDISHPAVVGLLSRMEQNGHLVTWINPENKRLKMVKLTPGALELESAMDAMREKMEKLLLDGFSEEEAGQLKNLLSRVHKNLSKLQSR